MNQSMNIDEHQQLKNRRKLIAQNKKLHSQILLIEDQMSSLIERRAENSLKESDQNPQLQSQRQQIAVQQNYINKLKKKISSLKAGNVQSNNEYIKKQENELIFLKSELSKLMSEKQVLTKLRDDKKKALGKNEPLDTHKNHIEQQMINVRKENRQMLTKINALEKEIRKHHQIIQLSKIPNPVIDNPEYEITKLNHSINEIQRKMKQINDKWQPQLDALDSQYFGLIEVLQNKNNKLDELQKELKGWQIRSIASRNENDVLIDRARISKVPQLQQGKRFSDFMRNQMEVQLKRRLDRTPQRRESIKKLSPKKQIQSRKQQIKKQQIKKQQIKKQQIKKQSNNKQQSKKQIINNKINVSQQLKQNKNSKSNVVEQKNKGVLTDSKEIIPLTKISQKNKNPQNRSQTYSAHKLLESKHQIRSQRKWKDKKQSSNSNRNEFLLHNQSEKGTKIRQKQKIKKLLKNIGVGTSFYYDE